jgi:hypothetical protein
MMRVFTSVFVVDGLHTSFEDLERALRNDEERSESAAVTGTCREQIASLHLWMETPRNRTGRERA